MTQRTNLPRNARLGGLRKPLALLALGVLLSDAHATAPRVAPEMFGEEKTVDIVAYESAAMANAAAPDKGLAVTIVREAFQAAAMEVTLDVLPAKPLAKYALLNNEAVAMIGRLSDLNAQEKTLATPEAFYVETGYWHYYKPAHANGINWRGNLAELQGMTVGALAGDDTESYKKANLRVIEGDGRGLLEQLHGKTLDLAALPRLLGQSLINASYPQQADNFARLTPPLWEKAWCLLFARKNARGNELKAAFGKGLEALIKSGKYMELLEQHADKDNPAADVTARLARFRQNPH